MFFVISNAGAPTNRSFVGESYQGTSLEALYCSYLTLMLALMLTAMFAVSCCPDGPPMRVY